MNPFNFDNNGAQMRAVPHISENNTMIQMIDDSIPYNNLPNHIVEFSQRVQMASDFMALEEQEFNKKIKEQKQKLKEFQEKFKEFKQIENSFKKNGENNVNSPEDGKINNDTFCSQSPNEIQWEKYLNLKVLENSLSEMKKCMPLSQSSRSLLEARLANIKKMNKTQEKLSSNQTNHFTERKFQGFAEKEGKPTKNSRKIEKILSKFVDCMNMSNVFPLDPIEEHLLKKSKLNEDLYVPKSSKTYGYTHSDFRKIKKYKPQASNLPLLGDYFEEDKIKIHLLMTEPNGFETPKHKSLKNFLKPTNKPPIIPNHDSEFHILTMESHIPVKMINGKQEAFLTLEEIPQKDDEKDLAKEKVKKMRPEEIDKLAKQTIKKAWQNVVRNIIRIYRFVQKDHMDREQNSRKFALLCSKEVRKKYLKSQRMHREYQFRAKRMQKEMLVYWRKRERELNEIKKRKEKLEGELKRREEEERESLLQKKRLEFLMKQSDIYAHFMARKLGIAIHDEAEKSSKMDADLNSIEKPSQNENEPMNNGNTEPNFKPEIEIDENAALENVHMMINEQREMLLNFDKETQEARMMAGGPMGNLKTLEQYSLEEVKNAQNLDFSYVPQDTFTQIINTPVSFVGELKEYQLKGLRWLDNLYEQGINGILADEMGLGKTIQAIALLAHIFENKHNCGPFLIVAPSSTLYNWQQEIKRFCPILKVLPYWGNLKQRKTIRKFFSLKNLGAPNSPFHIVITSYQLIVADEKTFQKMKWQYVILDEAQAIKNINSQRWKTLLSFNSRNKLLLTGTPIQNTMAELWALLHFIMPKLFDSHEQFQEWFSKDIEAHSQDQKAVNQHQLSRLHAILKPFMLRRVKKDVEHEIGQKKEFQILCEMTNRQQELYDNIKKRLSIKDFFHMLESKAKVESLMNLVMQFRKVCNHPELFERRPCRSPFCFQPYYYYTGNLPVYFGQLKEIICNAKNPIELVYPKLVYEELSECFLSQRLFLNKNLLIWNANHIHQEIVHEKGKTFGFLRLLGLSPALMELLFQTDDFFLAVFLLHFHIALTRKFKAYGDAIHTRNILWINKEILLSPEDKYRVPTLYEPKTLVQIRNMWIPYNINKMYVYLPSVQAPNIQFICSSQEFTAYHNYITTNRIGKMLYFGEDFGFHKRQIEKVAQLKLTNQTYLKYPYNSIFPEPSFCLFPFEIKENLSKIEIPDFVSLIADSAKLNYLDKMLTKLKKNKHRVLIFCQMTKMLDILEDYLMRKKYPFFRLDGSCNIADRRDMVHEFQNNHKIFAFLLSTRAGGLGVTLTAADTVIFYDNDWNPTMDAQATDRAHRIGQTKEVHVYRLVTKGTIEERILKRAQQKQTVQATVYSGGAFKADIFKPQEVMELLFDENEIDVSETTKFMNRGGKRFKGKKKEIKLPPIKEKTISRRGKKIEKNNSSNDDQIKPESMEEEKGVTNNEEKNEMDIEMDFSPLMMNNENDEVSSDVDEN